MEQNGVFEYYPCELFNLIFLNSSIQFNLKNIDCKIKQILIVNIKYNKSSFSMEIVILKDIVILIL